MRERPRLAAGIAGVLCLAPAAPSAAVETLEDTVRRIVVEERARHEAPALAVTAIRGDEVVTVLSGFADAEAGVQLTAETRFPAASVSKLLTTVLVMRAVEAGQLDLDTPANESLDEPYWIRDAEGNPVPATLRQLLSHHSGLPVAWSGIAPCCEPPETMEARLARGMTTIHPPGTEIVYANDAFTLAGFLVAQAAGEPFARHAERVLLEPLGMTHSSFESPWHFEGPLTAAYGDLRGGSARTDHADPMPNAPAGALLTTTADLARFAHMLLGGGALDGVRILEPASVDAMMQIEARAHPALDEGFALGFAVRERPGWKLVWWDGSLPGAAARFALLPEHGVAVAVLSNLANNTLSSITGLRVLDAMVPRPPLPEYEVDDETIARPAGAYRLRDAVDPELSWLGALAAFSLAPDDGVLRLRSWMFGDAVLHPVGPDRFRLRGGMLDDATVLFDSGREGLALGTMRARRVSWFASPDAFVVYALGLAVAMLTGLWLGARGIIRRARTARRARRPAARPGP